MSIFPWKWKLFLLRHALTAPFSPSRPPLSPSFSLFLPLSLPGLVMFFLIITFLHSYLMSSAAFMFIISCVHLFPILIFIISEFLFPASLSLSLQNANTFCQNTLPPWQCCILKLCTFHTSMRRRPLCPKTKMLYCYSLGCGATVLSIALKAPLVLHVQQEPRGFQGLFLWDIKHMR